MRTAFHVAHDRADPTYPVCYSVTAMQAVVWNGERAQVMDQPVPRPQAGVALVRVMLAGICSADLEIVKGYMNFRGVLKVLLEISAAG
jgi:threonine dehydrogenase-like Zn-dependent dehydrogenase